MAFQSIAIAFGVRPALVSVFFVAAVVVEGTTVTGRIGSRK
jgi:hypothetical protein